jgi:hypothetical protein
MGDRGAPVAVGTHGSSSVVLASQCATSATVTSALLPSRPYVTGTHVASVADDPLRDGRELNRVISLAHAVAPPVIDGLAMSVCGVLVTAIADQDRQATWNVPRCEECQRIAG